MKLVKVIDENAGFLRFTREIDLNEAIDRSIRFGDFGKLFLGF